MKIYKRVPSNRGWEASMNGEISVSEIRKNLSELGIILSDSKSLSLVMSSGMNPTSWHHYITCRGEWKYENYFNRDLVINLIIKIYNNL